jgi:hypothetical protein
MARRGVNLPRGLFMYRLCPFLVACLVSHKGLKENFKDTRCLFGLKAALMPAVIIIQPPPFPNEYPRGHDIRVLLPGVEQLSKTSIGGSWPVVAESIGVQLVSSE